MTTRRVCGAFMLAVFVHTLATSDGIHHIAAAIAHAVPLVLLGAVVVPVGLLAAALALAPFATVRQHR